MSKTDNFSAPKPADLILNQLGIDVDNSSSTFDPKNQPISIGRQFQKMPTNARNKYAEAQVDQAENQQSNNIDEDIPKNLLQISTIKKNKQIDSKPKGRKKQSKRNAKKANSQNKQQEDNKKKQVQIDIGVGEVAEWGEKGTKAYNDDDQDEEDFDGQPQNNYKYTSAEQQAARKRIEEKLKKYQNPGSGTTHQQKSTSNSLKNKALELKSKNQTSNAKNQKIVNMDQSSQQLINLKKQKKQEIVKEQQQQQSEDPWDKVNEKTEAQKQQEQQALKNAENVDFNKYYQNLSLPGDDQLQQDPEPQTGFFQSLCACLKPKKKSITDLQKQIIKISRIQLTNKPEQIQLLKQIWTKLTSKKYLRYGQHWNQIGFQGRDPSTDLRSTGILSLLQWNNFLNFDIQYATKLFNFCMQFDIPLALTHIKITSLVCSSIKNRQLQGKKWQQFMQWYYAFTYFTFQYLMQNGKNLQQIGELVQKSIERTKNNIQNAKKYFNTQIKSKR